MDLALTSQIVVQTAAQWAADSTVYSAKRLLVVSDTFFGATDQRKYKLADGVQTFAQLDFIPISGYDDATSSIQTQLNGKAGLTSPTFINDITTPLIIGGTAVGSGITFKSTTGVGTTTGIAHQFTGGTNGATALATIYNDGQFLVGGTTRTATTLANVRFTTGSGSTAGVVDIGQSASGRAAIWMLAGNGTVITANNYNVAGDPLITYINAPNATGSVQIRVTNTSVPASFALNNSLFQCVAATSGATTQWQYNPGSSTNQTASTEHKTIDVATATIQSATGAITTDRGIVFNARTRSFVAASTITNAATLAITGNPIAGTNSTITNPIALWIQSGKLQVDGSITATTYNNTPCEIQLAASDETTALTTGTGKVTFRMPYAMTLTAVRASVTTAATGATLLTVDINEAGTSILSTKLTFDASEKTTTTAATPAVISDTALADDAEITIDIDAVGSTIAGAGLKVTLIGTRA